MEKHRASQSLMETDGSTEWLTAEEVAKLFRVHIATVGRWAKSGALESVTLPHAHKRQIYRFPAVVIKRRLDPKPVTPHVKEA